MCDPVTAAAALAVGAGAMNAYGTYQGHQMEARAADANAAEALATGYRNELSFRDQARRDIALQTAKLAANGADISGGTPLLLLAESARNSELDALAIRRGAVGQHNSLRYQAKVHRYSAPISAAGQLLSGAAKGAGTMSELGAIGGPPSSVGVTPQVFGSNPGGFLG